jgi:hypothetical protein
MMLPLSESFHRATVNPQPHLRRESKTKAERSVMDETKRVVSNGHVSEVKRGLWRLWETTHHHIRISPK